MSPRAKTLVVVVALLWIGWCVVVVTELVPVIARHITMWNWLMAYVLCLLPPIAFAIAYLVRTRRPS